MVAPDNGILVANLPRALKMSDSLPDLDTLHYYMKAYNVYLLAPELFAIALTAFRLHYRRRMRALWWDDYFALLSMLLMILLSSSVLLMITRTNWSFRLHYASWWMACASSFLPYTTKISLALAIGRIMPPGHPVFKATIRLSVFLGVFGVCLTLWPLVICLQDLWWLFNPPFFCVPSKVAVGIVMTVDISYDLILVFLPLRLFWDVRLERGAKLLVLAGFAGSLLTVCAVGLAGVIMVLPLQDLPEAARSTIQAIPLHIVTTCALIACNTLVVITYIYRFWKKSDEDLVASLYTLSRPPSTTRDGSFLSSGFQTRSNSAYTDAGLTTITESFVLTEVSTDWSNEPAVSDRSIGMRSSRPKIHSLT